MVVVDHFVHKYDEILSSVHHGGHPASHHGPPGLSVLVELCNCDHILSSCPSAIRHQEVLVWSELLGRPVAHR